MTIRKTDGSAGDADYGSISVGYQTYRQPEPEFANAISAAMEGAHSVINVGAGAGSYEPSDREVTAVEPSASMRAQRPTHLSTAIDAVAESLPFADNSFDAALTTFSVHQWQNLDAGRREMRRVARGPVVILTCDPTRLDRFWLNDYAPEVIATEARRYPTIEQLTHGLGGDLDIRYLRIPLLCVDGFSEAYYGRPEMFLDSGARTANSAWSFVAEDAAEQAVAALEKDLASGVWDARHGELRSAPHFEGSLALITAHP